MKLQFLGAAGCVTGSKHLVTTESGTTILLDCGMYQGKGMETDAMNRELGLDPRKLDFVVLSHAHIDHSGLIPYLVKEGFKGTIYCTSATRDLCDIMLRDTAYIQAQDIRWYNKKMDRQHKPKEDVLYDINHVEKAMNRFQVLPYECPTEIAQGVKITLTNSGHMLGSAYITVEADGKRLVYTGDVGREKSHILPAPKPIPDCDYLITESTYGDRLHDDALVSEQELLGIVNDTCVYRKGKLLIPSFSVGRTQEIVYVLNKLYNEQSLPAIPIYVDSPLSVKATEVFRRYTDLMNADVVDTAKYDDDVFGFQNLHYITDIEESKALNHSDKPCIIISASGMLEAGRIKHHVANHIDDPTTTILIVGYCTPESLGARIQDPKREFISIFGFDHRIRAQVTKLEGFSGHADYAELSRLLAPQAERAQRTFIVHGEPKAAEAMRDHLYETGFRNIEVALRGDIKLL